MSGYETIVSAVFSAMVLFCDFEKDDFDKITFFNEQNGKNFADSIEQYNSSDDEHRPDTLLLLEYCTTQSNIKKRGKLYAFLFNAKKTIKIKLSVLFPKMSHLKETYPYLRKHPH